MSVLQWLFEATISFGSKSIAIREIIGGLLGLSSAILGARRLVAAWPVGILGDALLFTVFLGAVFSFGDESQHANFYGQASRNLLLIIVSIYGWVRWSHHKRLGKEDGESFGMLYVHKMYWDKIRRDKKLMAGKARVEYAPQND